MYLCTSVVDEQIQSGLHFQESFSEGADGLQTGEVQMHVDHVSTSCLLEKEAHHQFIPLN